MVARRDVGADVVLPAAAQVIELMGIERTQDELAQVIERACRRDATWAARQDELTATLTPEERAWLVHMAGTGSPR